MFQEHPGLLLVSASSSHSEGFSSGKKLFSLLLFSVFLVAPIVNLNMMPHLTDMTLEQSVAFLPCHTGKIFSRLVIATVQAI